MNTPYPRTFSHIGISVPDLEAAVKFYTEVLGSEGSPHKSAIA